MQKNYYKILGVNQNASQDDIKKAYRELAKKHHPDTNQGVDDSVFKDISEAYSVLSDLQKKKQYDFSHGGQGIFHDIFGGINIVVDSITRSFRRFSLNQKINVQIKMDQAYVGSKISFNLQRMKECKDCKGTGSQSTKDNCGFCSGTGKIMQGSMLCYKCKGTGKNLSLCQTCNGNGSSDELIQMTVNVPPRTMMGSNIVLKEQGNLSSIGKRGDLSVTFVYEPTIEGVELLPDGSLIKNISVPWDSILLEENLSFKIFNLCVDQKIIKLDSSLPSSAVYVIKNAGMSVNKDLFVKVWYELPTNIDKESERKIARIIRNAQSSRTTRQNPV